jgi:F0F1-type ATP synthase membrane subunit c/vacuolar-type H+-ATPase subunit K
MRLTLCGAAIAVMLAVAGCGGSSGSKTNASAGATTESTPQQTQTVLHYVIKEAEPRTRGRIRAPESNA